MNKCNKNSHILNNKCFLRLFRTFPPLFYQMFSPWNCALFCWVLFSISRETNTKRFSFCFTLILRSKNTLHTLVILSWKQHILVLYIAVSSVLVLCWGIFNSHLWEILACLFFIKSFSSFNIRTIMNLQWSQKIFPLLLFKIYNPVWWHTAVNSEWNCVSNKTKQKSVKIP